MQKINEETLYRLCDTVEHYEGRLQTQDIFRKMVYHTCYKMAWYGGE